MALLESEINIDLVLKCVKQLEEFLNKGIKSGSYDMKEVHMMYECYVAVYKTVEQCDIVQKKLKMIMKQNEVVKQPEAKQPDAV
jgi:hypothetical protein